MGPEPNADGAAADWREVTFTGTLITGETRCCLITTSENHDFVKDDEVGFGFVHLQFSTGPYTSGEGPILAVPSPNTIGVEMPYSATATGYACKPNRLNGGLVGVTVPASSAYPTSAKIITAAAPYYFDTNEPFAGGVATTYSRAGVDLLLDPKDTSSAVNDQFHSVGNYNVVWILGGLNIPFWGMRGGGAKIQFWVSTRFDPKYQAAQVLMAGAFRGRDQDTFASLDPVGAATGLARVGMHQTSGSALPGFQAAVLEVPYKLGGLGADMAPAFWNGVRAKEDRLTFGFNGVSVDWTAAQIDLKYMRVRGNPATVYGLDVAGGPNTGVTVRPWSLDGSPNAAFMSDSLGTGGNEMRVNGSRAFRATSGAVDWMEVAAATGQVTLQRSGASAAVTTRIGSKGVAPVVFLNPPRLPSYTVATLPSASAIGAGANIYVTNESGGAVPAFSDATNWRRVTDRAVVS